jgi:hypothetical protein
MEMNIRETFTTHWEMEERRDYENSEKGKGRNGERQDRVGLFD